MKHIHSKIRQVRELKGISSVSMANDMNISVSAYSKIERGEISLSVPRLLEIAKLLDIDVNQILDFDPKEIFTAITHATSKQEHIPMNDYREKYIKMLEEEVSRLKTELKQLKESFN